MLEVLIWLVRSSMHTDLLPPLPQALFQLLAGATAPLSDKTCSTFISSQHSLF